MYAKLLENKFRVLFITTELIQKLQASKQALTLTATLAKLDKYDRLILDDFGYANKDLMETNVLFELISERYERKSLIITCNQPFSEMWILSASEKRNRQDLQDSDR